MILDSSTYSDDPLARQWASQVYTNAALNGIAQNNEAFRPVNGDTGNKADDEFVLQVGRSYLLAVFNFDSIAAKTISVPLDRISPGMTVGGTVKINDLSENAHVQYARNDVVVNLAPSASELLQITPEGLGSSQ